jgi:tRNA A37 N6-isopentenylltransferase MiaA
MDIDFYTQYININFDQVLLDNNNPVINSQELYLNYKQDYINQSLKNFQDFKMYKNTLLEIDKDASNISPTKYVFIYKNEKLIEQTKQNIKNIIIQQEKLLKNFQHYISILNRDPSMFQPRKNTNEKRSFLSKLFDKKKT